MIPMSKKTRIRLIIFFLLVGTIFSGRILYVYFTRGEFDIYAFLSNLFYYLSLLFSLRYYLKKEE